MEASPVIHRAKLKIIKCRDNCSYIFYKSVRNRAGAYHNVAWNLKSTSWLHQSIFFYYYYYLWVSNLEEIVVSMQVRQKYDLSYPRTTHCLLQFDYMSEPHKEYLHVFKLHLVSPPLSFLSFKDLIKNFHAQNENKPCGPQWERFSPIFRLYRHMKHKWMVQIWPIL